MTGMATPARSRADGSPAPAPYGGAPILLRLLGARRGAVDPVAVEDQAGRAPIRLGVEGDAGVARLRHEGSVALRHEREGGLARHLRHEVVAVAGQGQEPAGPEAVMPGIAVHDLGLEHDLA